MMDDLISRQAAIDALDKHLRTTDVPVSYPGIISALTEWLNEVPSAQADMSEYSDKLWKRAYERGKAEAQQMWIPCSERLPEEEGWYITTIENEKTGRRRIENDLFAIGIAEAHGNTPYKFCKDGYRQKTIAWMPFPEPYQAERRTDG